MKLVWPRILPRNNSYQLVAEPLHVLRGRAGIRQNRHLLVDFGCGLKTKLFLLLLGNAR